MIVEKEETITLLPEEWKTVENYDNYEVSNFGVIRNKVTNTILKCRTTKQGYKTVCLSLPQTTKKHMSVHRLVARAFIQNDLDLPEVDHINRRRDDNNLYNLRWASRSDQARNRIHNHQSATLQQRAVAQYNLTTGALIKIYASAKAAGSACGLNRETVLRSCKGRANGGGYTWKYVVTPDLDGEIWKEVPAKYNVNGYYVSNMGRIKYPNERVIDTIRTGRSYRSYIDISLKDRQYRAHIVMAETFLDPPQEGQILVNHIDGDIANNKISNLEWITPSGNSLHAHATGLSNTSKRIQRTDSRDDTIAIFRNIKECAKNSGISKNTLSTVLNNKDHPRKKAKYYTFNIMDV
jgi:hypothetical protein